MMPDLIHDAFGPDTHNSSSLPSHRMAVTAEIEDPVLFGKSCVARGLGITLARGMPPHLGLHAETCTVPRY